ncbi:NAD(+) diphosphatase [Clavibacter sp. km1a]|uniref:NAD(+) diphosphatase n=1 Tax=Clavibacter sp. km1a TaxID=3459136 RepID=UPI004041635F
MLDSFLSRLPLSREGVDRDGLRRDSPALFDELWADPATRVLALHGHRALGSAADGPAALDLLPVDRVTSATIRIYLGRTTVAHEGEPVGTPVVAAVLSDAAALALEPAEERWLELRATAVQLDDRDAALFTGALATANWHASHPFSPKTGEPTVVEQGGWVRRAPSDGSQVFPRTDAAVIMGVVDQDDRLLLGANAMWGGDRYSLLAGFVEPGESFEAAVKREVLEESGVTVEDPRYLGSQPWPFPASVMVGFLARVAAESGPATPDGTEIIDLRWFSREELHASLGEIALPGPSSIARAIIEEWYGGPLEDGEREW